MQKRQLGTTDLELTTIGLGTWAIGGGDWLFGWGDQNEQDAVAGVRRAIELGVNWIDTAVVYGFGESEKLVGAAIRELPAGERPFIATKCGRVRNADGTIGKSLKHDSVIAECERSLINLGVECIDLYQMHWPEPDEDIEEGWGACAELVKQGKVRHIGVSNHNVSHMKRLQPIHPIASLQPPYSMFARDIESEILPFCGEQNIGVICYSPMGKGLLTGAFTKERAEGLSDKDHRSRDPNFSEPRLSINLACVESVRSIAESNDRPLSHLSIAWVLRHDAMTSAIVGARNPQQIEQTSAAADWVLTENDIAVIETALAERDHALSQV